MVATDCEAGRVDASGQDPLHFVERQPAEAALGEDDRRQCLGRRAVRRQAALADARFATTVIRAHCFHLEGRRDASGTTTQ